VPMWHNASKPVRTSPATPPEKRDGSASAETLSSLRFVLVTPARNEAEFIERTIQSVVAQTTRPVRWVIVSDGSKDGTDEIVKRYAAEHDWIELLRTPERTERHFAGKARAFQAGYRRLNALDYDCIGSVDADISFEPDFFSFLMERFQENPRLGVVGTPFQEGGISYDFRFSSVEHVSGACQLFRRKCFEAIGGYLPVKGGGIDVIAVLAARQKGWETRTFLEKSYEHHRPQSSAKYGILRARFLDGVKDYRLGGHPIWEIFRGVYQMTRHPWIMGGCCLIAGYTWAAIRRVERPMPPDLIAFRRHSQMKRLRVFLGGTRRPA
jgi:biofilm PGA synthesis N-glycosyltransferase PgaC